MPSNVITGQFEVKILHYRNSKLVSQQINSINVSKSGISAEIYDIAQNYSTLYGILVLLAVLVGWGSNLILEKFDEELMTDKNLSNSQKFQNQGTDYS